MHKDEGLKRGFLAGPGSEGAPSHPGPLGLIQSYSLSIAEYDLIRLMADCRLRSLKLQDLTLHVIRQKPAV